MLVIQALFHVNGFSLGMDTHARGLHTYLAKEISCSVTVYEYNYIHFKENQYVEHKKSFKCLNVHQKLSSQQLDRSVMKNIQIFSD